MLRAGEIAAMNVGLSAVIDENSKGADLRLIAASANTMSFGFFGAPGVTDAEGVRGKKVAVSTLRSESDAAAMLGADRARAFARRRDPGGNRHHAGAHGGASRRRASPQRR